MCSVCLCLPRLAHVLCSLCFIVSVAFNILLASNVFHVRAQVRIAHLGGYFSLPPGLHCCCSMSKPLLLFGMLTTWLRSVAPILFQGGWAVFCKLRVRAAFFFSLSSSHPWLMFTCVMLRSCLLVLCQIGPMGLQGNISDASAVIQYMCNQADVQMVSIRM